MIPKLHYISQGNSPKEHIENIQKACSSGAELVQLNIKNISEKKIFKICKRSQRNYSSFSNKINNM